MNKIGPSLKADEFLHRSEHSVEFQAVWLKTIFRDGINFSILPLLCGSFHELVEKGLTPEDSDEYLSALEVLKETLQKWGESNGHVLILASADISHVGSQFGDKRIPATVFGITGIPDADSGVFGGKIRTQGSAGDVNVIGCIHGNRFSVIC